VRPGRADKSVEVTLAAEPEATDQKIDEAGATVFVDETAAEFLDDKTLDASVEAKGVRFTILNPRTAPSGPDRPTDLARRQPRVRRRDRLATPVLRQSHRRDACRWP
jgi:hypothetical protein